MRDKGAYMRLGVHRSRGNWGQRVARIGAGFAALALVVALGSAQPAADQGAPSRGILLLAHGGSPQWNEGVLKVARAVNQATPTEVAFGMASRASIQAAIDALTARGVTEILAVPLFVSSHSSVVTSTEFLLGLRKDAPADLAVFAKMDHARHGAPAVPAGHGDHAPAADPASPVVTRLPVRMTPALDRHVLVGQILADRARAISAAPADEAVILVAHGPVPDEDNQRWLADMAVLAQHVRAAAPFAAVDYLTVRDDAGPAMREAATLGLRDVVARHSAAGRRVLVVPHLLSFGGIEQGIRKRLEGLDYTMTTQALMPDDRIIEWVLLNAR